MTWTYRQSTGALSQDGQAVASGYSGLGAGKNNPALEADAGVGPIPCGAWSIGEPHDSPHVGPYAMGLSPIGHDAHGRSAFLIHGDSASHPGQASHGCIILPRTVRQRIWESHDHRLEVVT